MKVLQVIFLIFVMFLQASAPVLAQDEGSEDLAEDFTGTLENPDEDEDENFDPFDDENDDSADDEDSLDYTLDITTETSVTFSDLFTGEASTSVKYVTHIKQDLSLTRKTAVTLGYAEVETEIVGQYAGNQFFSCTLEVEIETTPVEIKTRLAVNPETEDAPETHDLALQVKFDKSYGEIWYSYCQGNDASSLNTVALDSPDNYNLQIWDLFKPSLAGLMLEDFQTDEGATFPIHLESFEAEDYDTSEKILYEGSGTVTLLPQ